MEYYGKEKCFAVSVEVPDTLRKERTVARGSFTLKEWLNRQKRDSEMFTDSFISEYVNFHTDNSGELAAVLLSIRNGLNEYNKVFGVVV